MSTVVLLKGDPWAEGDLSILPMRNKALPEEEGEKEGRGKKKEEGMGRKCEDRGTDEDTSPVGRSIDAGSTFSLSASVAMAALLSLDVSNGRRGEGTGKGIVGADKTGNSHAEVQCRI
jgi:hypothetical protein